MGTRTRQHRRVELPAVLEGSMDFRKAVRLVNLSPAGAMVEHVDSVSPGGRCLLVVQLLEGALRLSAQIVWSHVTGIERQPNGDRQIRFRSGLQFLALPEKAEGQIRQYLATLIPAPDEARAASPSCEGASDARA